jgi:hypothetical protein
VIAAGAAALGYTGLKMAIYAYPASNLLGGWALLFGPLLWVGTLGLMILVLPCAITRLFRYQPDDQKEDGRGSHM